MLNSLAIESNPDGLVPHETAHVNKCKTMVDTQQTTDRQIAKSIRFIRVWLMVICAQQARADEQKNNVIRPGVCGGN